MRIFLILVFFTSCVATKDDFQEWQDESVAELLAEDKANKELELMYLDEIGSAQDNNDSEALDFYLREYLNVPRLDIPDHLKSDPRYFEGGNSIKY